MVDDGDKRLAPEGATCELHPERPALIRCPQCSGDACIACWHYSIDRCERCLRADPAAAAEPIPWETTGPLARRVLGTLFAALRPTRTAPSFAQSDTSRAWLFALGATVPLLMLRGVIPLTHTIRFGPYFAVTPIGQPTAGEIGLDILQAMTLSLGMGLIALSVGGFAYVNLSKAYGDERAVSSALRFLLYRSWLLPLSHSSGLSYAVAVWGFPERPTLDVQLLAVIGSTIPLLLFFVGSRATARMASAVPPLASFAVTLIPLFLLGFVETVLIELSAPWLPSPAGPPT